MVEVSTSILSVKKEEALGTFYNLEVAKTDYFHIDVMDGKFVEQDTTEIMHEYCSHIKKISNLPLDVHLMVEDIKFSMIRVTCFSYIQTVPFKHFNKKRKSFMECLFIYFI